MKLAKFGKIRKIRKIKNPPIVETKRGLLTNNTKQIY
jgi:hypothetical protein